MARTAADAAIALPVRASAAPHPAARRAGATSMDVEQLYRRYGDMVLGRCRTLLRNEADAQEAAQEVFVRVIRYKDDFRGESSPTTWLYRVTTTTCLNRMRTRRRHPEELPGDPPDLGAEDAALAGHEVRDLLGRLLALSDATTQACLLYHYLDGMTHEETGAMVGLGPAAVRKRIAGFRDTVKNDRPAWLEGE